MDSTIVTVLRLLLLIAFLLIVVMATTAHTAFTEEPMSQTVNEGEQATFRCQHPRAIFLLWKLDNISLNQHPPQNVFEQVTFDSAGNELELLIISALAVVEFNGTEIVCEAHFIDGSPSEVSSPAILRVNATVSNSTAENNGFVIVPINHTVARDREALFHCQNSMTERIHWEINGTAVNIVHPEGVILHIDGSDVGSTLHTLSIRGNLHYNLTTVMCVASFTNAVFRTEPAILSVVDGNIGPVVDVVAVNGSRIVLQWSPPFTLDLTGITPDVIYCVDVFNISNNGDDNRVVSTCDVMETEYIFTHDYANPAHEFMFIITPRLNVENAINGTQSEPVFGSFDDHCKPAVYSSPTTDQYVPVNSRDNVTFSCSVESGNTVVWAVNGTQVTSDDQFDTFTSLGYFIEPMNRLSDFSTISISHVARSRLNHTDLRIQCISSLGIETCEGSTFSLITYDTPSKVVDLDLLPSLNLVWSRPSEPPFPQVPISYTIEINATEGGGMNFRNFTSDTSLSVQFLEDMLRELGSECVEFQIIVSATNNAGTGPLARMRDTVPISPDVRSISRELRVMSVDLQSQTAQVLFPPVMACSVTFSLTNYTINIGGAVHRILTPGDVMLGVPFTISNLVQDVSSSLTVTACNSVTCRTSDSRTLNTTDVQTVQAVFYENRLFLSCSFAANSQAQGCVFEFTINNTDGTNRYNVSRQDGSVCTEAPYCRGAYGNIVVMDWEENGEDGGVTLNVTNSVMNVSTLLEFITLTGCQATEADLQATSDVVTILVAGFFVGMVIPVLLLVVYFAICCTIFRKRRHKSPATLQLKKMEHRVASDSGEEVPLLYECEIITGNFQHRIIESLLAGDKGRVTKNKSKRRSQTKNEKATTASGPPPPPTFGYLSDKGQTIEMESMEAASSRPSVLPTFSDIEIDMVAMSAGPPPPPIFHSSGVIEMETTQTTRKPSAVRVAPDSGDISTPDLEDIRVVAMSAGPPPPPIYGEISSFGVIEMPEISMSAGPPPPPPMSQYIGISGVIEMPEESTASGTPTQPRVITDYGSPAESDGEVTAVSTPLLKDVDKIVKQEVDKRVKQELDKQVKQELDKRVKRELDERVKWELEKRVAQELDKRVRQELEERVTRELDERVKQKVHSTIPQEVDKRVRLEYGDSGAPLALKVQWKSLIESLLARGGNKHDDFSKLKLKLEF